MLYAQIYGLMENKQLQKKYYESARNILETKIQEQLDDEQFPERFHSSLGIVYVGLGREDDAIREGKRAVDLLPVKTDAWRGCYRVKDLAYIYVKVGRFEEAVEQLEFLLSRPSEMSIPLVELDPVWDGLRDHSDFKKLMEQGK